MSDQLTLGAPGIYRLQVPPSRTVVGARMDVCAFVGVAPRGPVWVPAEEDGCPGVPPAKPGLRGLWRSVAVPVESWDEYRWYFGSFEGPGLLPFAVASFFEQGGTRAYVVRVVHDWDNDADRLAAVSSASLDGVTTGQGGAPVLRARNEGTWGDRLRATISFQVRPLIFEASTGAELTLDAGADVGAGTLLLLSLPGGGRVLRFVTSVREAPRLDRWGRQRFAVFELPAPAPAARVDVVEATLDVEDTDRLFPRRERLERLGLAAEHPRWLARMLCRTSTLLWPDPAWIGDRLMPDGISLVSGETGPFGGGADRADLITPEDFFDRTWVYGDEERGDGVHALVDLTDVALVVAPDLYSPRPVAPVVGVVEAPSPLAGASFAPCSVPPPSPAQAVPTQDLTGLRLDPRDPGDRKGIVALQKRLVELADQLASFVVLLDVPPGLHQAEILAWRTNFGSSYAAAYHPWLRVKGPVGPGWRNELVDINPSAVAAGIVAKREHLFGVWYGPANELAAGVIDVADAVSPARHDELHQASIDVYLRERDGVRLTAGRTLTLDPAYRQLSVRRLMSMLTRVLRDQMQWMVFEPSGPALWVEVRHLLGGFLRHLYRAGAFEGASEEEAFFVRCDETLNPQQVVDQGRLLAEVGVAAAEPLEFLVLRIDRDGDGTLTVEASRG